jgi:hypothetical protein
MASVIMAVTYGHIAHRDGDPLLDRAHELVNIIIHINTPGKAALFTAFPFRGCLSAVYDINLNAQHVGYS